MAENKIIGYRANETLPLLDIINVKSPPKPVQKLPDPAPAEQSIPDRIRSTISSIFS